MRQYPSDIAFTPAVKAVQTTNGSRDSYATVERRGWRTRVTPDLAEFLAGLDMFYLGTASAAGQPYIQYRGGSPGFLKVLDDRTLVEKRGLVTDADVESVRAAGGGDTEIAEVVAHVALNTFTNYFNNVANTTIDFPKAPDLSE